MAQISRRSAQIPQPTEQRYMAERERRRRGGTGLLARFRRFP